MSETPGLDLTRFQPWLLGAHPELLHPHHHLSAVRLAGGLSNLTYLVEGGVKPIVLRRPPLGHVLNTAHDMHREFTIISALTPTAVPVPPALAYVDDSDDAEVAGVGTPFYLMDYVDGPILSRPRDNEGHSPAELRAVSLELAQVLAELHTIDPASIGLAEFGHPVGFVERQLRRWATQFDASRSRETPQLDALQQSLQAAVPTTVHDSLLHGDFRLDNVILREGRVAAVLDWEMATIGDSLLDLGTFSMYWDFAEITGGTGMGASAVDPAFGYPAFDELLDTYSAAVGYVVPPLGWYRAFAAYKLAVILEGIHLRFTSGKTVGPGFERIGEVVEPLAAWGARQLPGKA